MYTFVHGLCILRAVVSMYGIPRGRVSVKDRISRGYRCEVVMTGGCQMQSRSLGAGTALRELCGGGILRWVSVGEDGPTVGQVLDVPRVIGRWRALEEQRLRTGWRAWPSRATVGRVHLVHDLLCQLGWLRVTTQMALPETNEAPSLINVHKEEEEEEVEEEKEK